MEVGSLLDLLQHQEVCLQVMQCESGVQTMKDFQDQGVQQGGGSSLILHFGTIQALVQLCGSATIQQRT